MLVAEPQRAGSLRVVIHVNALCFGNKSNNQHGDGVVLYRNTVVVVVAKCNNRQAT